MRENDLLAWIAAETPAHPAVPLGIGDDMAAVTLDPARGPLPANLALLKIDQALDQVHFDLRHHSPAQAGRKAVNRCLSDCAAMACQPAGILLSVALPRTADTAFAQALFRACRDAAAVCDCPVVGGDTAIWDQRLAITVAALARIDHPPITRAAARPGDAICVSGALGGSILGRHLAFTPRIALALELARLVPLHAMMDLSDGLAIDLPRLCAASRVGACVELSRLPIHDDARTLADRDNTPAEFHVLSDGEDYELLFTLAPADLATLQTAGLSTPITRIGTITTEPELLLLNHRREPLAWPQDGWEHSSSA